MKRTFKSQFDKLARIGENPRTETQIKRAKKGIKAKFNSAIGNIEEQLEDNEIIIETQLNSLNPDMQVIINAEKAIANANNLADKLRARKKQYLETKVEVEREPIPVQIIK